MMVLSSRMLLMVRSMRRVVVLLMLRVSGGRGAARRRGVLLRRFRRIELRRIGGLRVRVLIRGRRRHVLLRHWQGTRRGSVVPRCRRRRRRHARVREVLNWWLRLPWELHRVVASETRVRNGRLAGCAERELIEGRVPARREQLWRLGGRNCRWVCCLAVLLRRR